MLRVVSFVSTCLAATWIFSASAQAQSFSRWGWLRDVLFGRSAPTEDATAALERLGGIRIVFALDADAVRKSMLLELQDETRRLLREARVGFKDLTVREQTVEVRIREESDLQQTVIKLGEASVPSSPGAAVEVRDVGERLVRLTPTETAIRERVRASFQQSIEVIERRLTELGIDASGVRPEDDRILVLLPGVKDPARVAHLLGSRGRLTFRMVNASDAPRDASDGRARSDSEILRALKSDQRYVVKKQVLLGGEDLADATPGFDLRTQQPMVSFRFNAHGSQRFAQVTQENVGQPFAIVLDDEVISAPIIREPILGGQGQLSGGFTIEEARDLAVLLRSGALPAQLNLIEQRVVDTKSSAPQ